MDEVGSLDSSRDLQPIRAKNFINRLHLVLHACVQIFDVIFFGVKIWNGLSKTMRYRLTDIVYAYNFPEGRIR